MPTQELTIRANEGQAVSRLLQIPRQVTACFVMAHGAGAGMNHPFLEAVATGFFDWKIATLRFQFPFMEKGSKRPDTPAIAQAAVRAAVAEAVRRLPDLSLFAGGKSFGGRMTSQAQAADPLPSVRGLAFLGFPLHAAQKPSDTRAAHLISHRGAHAVPPGYAGRTGRFDAASAGRSEPRCKGDPGRGRGRGSLVSGAGALGSNGCGRHEAVG